VERPCAAVIPSGILPKSAGFFWDLRVENTLQLIVWSQKQLLDEE